MFRAVLLSTLMTCTGAVSARGRDLNAGAAPTTVAMSARNWTASGDSVLKSASGGDILTITKGSALLNGVRFADGQIDFDIDLPASGIVGMRFREQRSGDAEVVYLRPQPNCAHSNDCIQYMPRAHGAYEWDLYPEFEGAAPVRPGWNHIRLRIAGKRMQVFVNQSPAPILNIDRLAGPDRPGALAFKGPARFAHLVVTPGHLQGWRGPAPVPAGTGDPGLVRNWRVSDATLLASRFEPRLKLSVGRPLDYADRPPQGTQWRAAVAEPKGLVNLSRILGSRTAGTAISVAWLATSVNSDRPQTKQVHFGWVREAWVFVNGRRIFSDRNLYGVPGASKAPDGRLSLTNASFAMPLRKGKNEILVALDDNFPGGAQHFGWGMMMRFDDPSGIAFQ